MSMYGDDDNGYRKENLYSEMKDFLEEHSISELLQIVTDCIRREKENNYD